MESLNNKIVDIISEQLEIDKKKIKPESFIIEDLGADSLDILEIIMKIEEIFDIEISDENAKKIINVKDFYDLIIKK